MKFNKQSFVRYALVTAVLAALVFSVSCGTQEETGMEPEQKAQEKPRKCRKESRNWKPRLSKKMKPSPDWKNRPARWKRKSRFPGK
jgi:hypothetical protein